MSSLVRRHRSDTRPACRLTTTRGPRVATALVILLMGAAGVADDPPERLKRKDRPQPELIPEKLPVMPREETQPAPDSEGTRVQQAIEATLARLTRNLEKTDERLKQKDAGESTQQVQSEVVRDFDALIEQMRRQQQQQQEQQQQQQQDKANAKRQPRSDQSKQLTKNDAGQKPQPGQQPQPGNQPDKQQTNTGQGGSGRTAEEQRKLADLYKDVWGHLPATLRQQMDAYGREQFMPKYNELLKQYYATLAEKGRQKGD